MNNKVLLLLTVFLLALSLLFPHGSYEKAITILPTVFLAGIINYRLAKSNKEPSTFWVVLSIFGVFSLMAHYGKLGIEKVYRR